MWASHSADAAAQSYSTEDDSGCAFARASPPLPSTQSIWFSMKQDGRERGVLEGLLGRELSTAFLRLIHRHSRRRAPPSLDRGAGEKRDRTRGRRLMSSLLRAKQ
jgi:hypothetical protein